MDIDVQNKRGKYKQNFVTCILEQVDGKQTRIMIRTGKYSTYDKHTKCTRNLWHTALEKHERNLHDDNIKKKRFYNTRYEGID